MEYNVDVIRQLLSEYESSDVILQPACPNLLCSSQSASFIPIRFSFIMGLLEGIRPVGREQRRPSLLGSESSGTFWQ